MFGFPCFNCRISVQNCSLCQCHTGIVEHAIHDEAGRPNDPGVIAKAGDVKPWRSVGAELVFTDHWHQGVVLWYPFIKILDKSLLDKEQKEAEAEVATAGATAEIKA